MSVKTIETMIDWVEENIEDMPILDRMADYIGYSPNQFRLVKPEIHSFERIQIM